MKTRWNNEYYARIGLIPAYWLYNSMQFGYTIEQYIDYMKKKQKKKRVLSFQKTLPYEKMLRFLNKREVVNFSIAEGNHRMVSKKDFEVEREEKIRGSLLWENRTDTPLLVIVDVTFTRPYSQVFDDWLTIAPTRNPPRTEGILFLFCLQVFIKKIQKRIEVFEFQV